jgi:sortase (surface protein transpeptidase)
VTRTIPAAAQTAPVTASGSGSEVIARSIPVRIEIPAINVRADVAEVGKNSDGSIQVPPLVDHNLAAWYRNSPAPGQRGASVIVGHVDSYTGPSVFYNLRYMRPGQVIYIGLADGVQARFLVNTVVVVPKSQFPTSSVYDAIPYPALRLITCGGPFDAASGHYLDNIIVYASFTGSAHGATTR